MVADREAAAERDRIRTLRLRTRAERGRGLARCFGALADRGAVVAREAVATDRGGTVAERVAAHRHRHLAAGVGTAADRDRRVFQRVGAVADRGAFLARSDGGEAFELAGVAVVDVGIAAERGRAFAGRLAAGAVGGGVGGAGHAVEAGGGGVFGHGAGAAAERRSAETDGVRGRTHGGGEIAFDVRALVVVGIAAGGEVFRAAGHVLELVEVHRIGALGARGDVGDLAVERRHAAGRVGDGTADRHGVGAIGNRVRAERDAVLRRRVAFVAQTGAVVDARTRLSAECAGADAVGAGYLPDRGVLLAIGDAADRHAAVAMRFGPVADRGTEGTVAAGLLADGHAPVASRGAGRADRGGAFATGLGHGADRDRTVVGGARGDADRGRLLPGASVDQVSSSQVVAVDHGHLAADRGGALPGRLAADAVGRRPLLAGDAAVAAGGAEFADRHRTAAVGGGAEADRTGAVAGRGCVLAFHIGTGAAVGAVGGLEEVVGVVRGLRHFLQLFEVHRIGVLGARGDVGDLAFFGEAVDVGPAPTETVLARSATEPVPSATLLSASCERIETHRRRAVCAGERRAADGARPARSWRMPIHRPRLR